MSLDGVSWRYFSSPKELTLVDLFNRPITELGTGITHPKVCTDVPAERVYNTSNKRLLKNKS